MGYINDPFTEQGETSLRDENPSMRESVQRTWAAASLCGAFAWALLACGSDPCDAGEVRAQLAAARPGGVVRVGACRLTGPFLVPAGVSLIGQGDASILEARSGTVVELEGGANTQLRAVRLESSGRAAIAVRGSGSASIEEVIIAVTRGIGIGIQGTTTSLARVRILGAVRSENARDPRWLRVLGAGVPVAACPGTDCECEPGAEDEASGRLCDAEGRWTTWTATLGIYAARAALTLEDVEIGGLAQYGLIADDSEIEWILGEIHDVIGVGVLLRGGQASLTDVSIERVVQGLRGLASYDVIATDGAVLDSTRLHLFDGDRYGLLVLNATGQHTSLEVQNHGDVGVWIGESEAFSIHGASVVRDNRFAGVVVSNSSHVLVEGAVVTGTRTIRRSMGAFGQVEVGDGIHLSGSYSNVRLVDLEIRGNERVGLLADIGDGPADVMFQGVNVDATETALGAIAGHRDTARGVLIVGAPAGWDTGIQRFGAALTNDAAASGELDAVVAAAPDAVSELHAIVAPMY